jgi:putative lipoic acid-binding regulatory protein
MNSDSPLKFPCDFPIKAMGPKDVDFPLFITEIIRRHAPDLDNGTLRVKESRHGRFQSVTLTIRASSREQLDAIYRDLSSDKRVIMAL